MYFFNIYHGIQGDSPSARRAWQEGWGAPERTRGEPFRANGFCHGRQMCFAMIIKAKIDNKNRQAISAKDDWTSITTRLSPNRKTARGAAAFF